VHPAIATAGSTMSRASARPNDRPAILIAAPSSGGAGECRAAHKKSPTSVTPYGFSFTTAAVRFRRFVFNHAGDQRLHLTPTILGQPYSASGDGIANLAPLD
jgi:hypothetical protein